MNRRAFLTGLLATVAAPALVRGASPIPMTLDQAYAETAAAISTALYGDRPVPCYWMGKSGLFSFNGGATDTIRPHHPVNYSEHL